MVVGAHLGSQWATGTEDNEHDSPSLEALFLSWGDILLELGRDGSFVGLLSTSAIAVT
jgi:hypothetical protein